MPVLTNAKHEHFAQSIAKGLTATAAYTSAGYSKAGAAQSAVRLLKNAQVCSRVKELAETIAAGTIALEIGNRNARVQALQHRWERLRAGVDLLLEERGADMAGSPAVPPIGDQPGREAEPPVPGGRSGVLCRDYKGKDADQPVYKVDNGLVSLLSELRAHERQAAQELGQWSDKLEIPVDGNLAERLIAARKRTNGNGSGE